jgi:hypothetical protein
MTPAEAATLLTVAAAFDNRKPDEAAAQAWALALDGLPFLDCRDAIVAHYRTSTDWLMPAVVRATVRKVRDKRLADAGDLTPPPSPEGLSPEGEVAWQIAWLADARRRVADGEAPEAYPGELTPRHLPDLRALMPSPAHSPTGDAARAPHTQEA